MDLEDQIINYFESKKEVYVKIDDEASIIKIYNLLINKILFEPTSELEFYYLGYYYQGIEVNQDLMKKYYSKAKKNSYTMNNLGMYYSSIGNYDSMTKYYLKAIKLKNPIAMSNLGYYYCSIKKYDMMKKYYLKSIKLGNPTAMFNLGRYYEVVEKNYPLMKKYYINSSDLGGPYAMNYLIMYNITNDRNVKNLKLINKYLDLIEHTEE